MSGLIVRARLVPIHVLAAAALLATGCDSPTAPTRVAPVLQPAPVTLTALAIEPGTVIAGARTHGVVSLSGPAPAAGFVVTLSHTPTSANTPESITIPAGATTGTFDIETSAVPPGSPGAQIVLDASAGTQRVTASLIVQALPAGTLETITIRKTTIIGGRPAVGTVTLNGPAPPGGLLVVLSTNNRDVRPQESVTVPAGTATVTFPVTTHYTPEDVEVVVTTTGGTSNTGTFVVLVAV